MAPPTATRIASFAPGGDCVPLRVCPVPGFAILAAGDGSGLLRVTGLTVTAIGYPMPRDASDWSTDEALLSPCLVLTAVKGQAASLSPGGPVNEAVPAHELLS